MNINSGASLHLKVSYTMASVIRERLEKTFDSNCIQKSQDSVGKRVALCQWPLKLWHLVLKWCVKKWLTCWATALLGECARVRVDLSAWHLRRVNVYYNEVIRWFHLPSGFNDHLPSKIKKNLNQKMGILFLFWLEWTLLFLCNTDPTFREYIDISL